MRRYDSNHSLWRNIRNSILSLLVISRRGAILMHLDTILLLFGFLIKTAVIPVGRDRKIFFMKGICMQSRLRMEDGI